MDDMKNKQEGARLRYSEFDVVFDRGSLVSAGDLARDRIRIARGNRAFGTLSTPLTTAESSVLNCVFE